MLFGCGQADKTTLEKPVDISKSVQIDNSNRFIYEFMRIVIADQKLNFNYGLELTPESNCSMGYDSIYLQTLLIVPPKKPVQRPAEYKTEIDSSSKGNHKLTFKKLNVVSTITLEPISMELKNCLTKEDIEHMLSQKAKYTSFKWDNSKLRFDEANDKNWYCFSVPLFSKDSTKAIIMIRDLCPGLCGSGSTVLYTKQNGVWTSQSGGQWYH